jgi:site-specific DNA recombinase
MENNRRRKMRVIPAHIKIGKRVAIYCCVSTTRGSQADSLKVQKYGLQQIVKNEPNWTLYRIYEDQGSGGNTSRPGFQSMIWDSYDNKFDTILVKSISRFARNAVDLLGTVNKLRGLGIEVVFEQENIRTSDHRQDLLIAVHTAMAQAEGESLSEAIKWGLRRGFETCESKLYTRKCFGHRHNEQGELIINEEQAIVVRMIFELYLKGYSVDMIMKELGRNNIKSPTGKEK